jgi:hypothetical protein
MERGKGTGGYKIRDITTYSSHKGQRKKEIILIEEDDRKVENAK